MDIVCDLVLLSWNHLEETRPCLASLVANTRLPVRLFLVDNGSEPEVRTFLASVKPQGQVQEVVLIQNETNEGFPRGMNRGIRASSAPFVCLLNNDTRFTAGWLEELIGIASAHPEVGLVNPASNTLGSRPARGVSLEEHGASLRSKSGQHTEVGMCIGFCLLIKREVIDRIGELTEEVERGFFEDEDYSMRAQRAGYRCVVAEASYVYHAEHRSLPEGSERDALFTRNQRWCDEKWGRRIRIAWPHFSDAVPASPELRQWLERVLDWTRRRTHVYVYCPTPPGMTRAALFNSVGLVPHADVHWHAVPRHPARWAAIGSILKRQKKRFDIIVAPDASWAQGIKRMSWLHRADVIPESDEERLKRCWQLRARLPSP